MATLRDDEVRVLLDERSRARPRDRECLTPDDLRRLHVGQMTHGERERAADHLASCGRCTDEYRVLSAIEQWAGEHQGAARSRPRLTARAAWITLPIAASLILVIGAMLARLGDRRPDTPATPVAATPAPGPAAPAQTPPSDVLAFAKPPVTLSASQALAFRSPGSGSDGFVDDFGAAIDPYRRDDFQAAAARLQALAAKYPDAFEAHFYLGVSLLMSERPSDAIAPLDRAAAIAKGDARQDAEWYAAIARGRSGHRDIAHAAFARICAARGRWSERACAAASAIGGSANR